MIREKKVKDKLQINQKEEVSYRDNLFLDDSYFYYGVNYTNEQHGISANGTAYFYGYGSLELEFNAIKDIKNWQFSLYFDYLSEDGFGKGTYPGGKNGEDQYITAQHSSGAYFTIGKQAWFDIDQSVLAYERSDDYVRNKGTYTLLGEDADLGGIVLGYKNDNKGINAGVLFSRFTVDGKKEIDNRDGDGTKEIVTKTGFGQVIIDDRLGVRAGFDPNQPSQAATVAAQVDSVVLGLIADYVKNDIVVKLRYADYNQSVNKDKDDMRHVGGVYKTGGEANRKDLYMSGSYEYKLNEDLYFKPVLNYVNSNKYYTGLGWNDSQKDKSFASSLMFGIVTGFGDGRFGITYASYDTEIDLTKSAEGRPNKDKEYDIKLKVGDKKKVSGSLIELGYERDLSDGDILLGLNYSTRSAQSKLTNSITETEEGRKDITENILRIYSTIQF